MSEREIERRIFVVGVPRSGTTLVQSLLAAHGAVASFTESHFFSRHFTLLRGTSRAVLTRDPTPRVREFFAENDGPAELENGAGADRRPASETGCLFAGERSADRVARWRLPFRTRAAARELLRVLDRLALARGKTTWVEKTPRHLRYAPFLERLAPGVRFVHVIRDGLETVASLAEASKSWSHPYDVETCVRRWNADVAFSLKRLTAQRGGRPRSEPADLFVLYERLTAEPAATLERLLADLGLDWQPEILERYAADAERLITPQETWKAGVSRPVRPSATSERVLNAEHRERARAALRLDLYERFLELSTEQTGS